MKHNIPNPTLAEDQILYKIHHQESVRYVVILRLHIEESERKILCTKDKISRVTPNTQSHTDMLKIIDIEERRLIINKEGLSTEKEKHKAQLDKLKIQTTILETNAKFAFKEIENHIKGIAEFEQLGIEMGFTEEEK